MRSFTVEAAGALTGGAVAMSPQGRVAADRETRMTAATGVFVAGDARLGPSLAVWAIREGREVAAEDRYLGALPDPDRVEPPEETRTGDPVCG